MTAIVRLSWWGTAVFAAVAVAAAASPRRLGGVALVLDGGLFAAGCVACVLAFLRAVQRSRTDAVGIGSLYFLAGDVAPARVRRRLLASLAVEVAVALATASARPYTELAGGVLVPVYGVGMCGLWAARHGRFPPRG